MRLPIAFIHICKKIMHYPVRLSSVKVIRIYSKERLVYKFLCSKERLTCTPRLGTSLRHLKALRKIIHFLIYIVDRNSCLFFKSVANDFHKISLNVFSYNDDNLVKSCLYGIKHTIVHNHFAFRTKGVKLLDSTVSAAHSCCHHHQCYIFHNYPLSIFICL